MDRRTLAVTLGVVLLVVGGAVAALIVGSNIVTRTQRVYALLQVTVDPNPFPDMNTSIPQIINVTVTNPTGNPTALTVRVIFRVGGCPGDGSVYIEQLTGPNPPGQGFPCKTEFFSGAFNLDPSASAMLQFRVTYVDRGSYNWVIKAQGSPPSPP